MKLLFVLPCLFIVTIGLAQDSLWKQIKIDENLSISMPGEVEIVDTLKNRAYKAISGETVYLIVTPINQKIHADNLESLKEVHDGMDAGFTDKMKTYGCKVEKPKPIIIDSIEGRSIRCYCDDPEFAIKEWIAHMFLINNKAYTISVLYGGKKTSQDQIDLKKYINSITFNSSNLIEKTFATKNESIAYKIGNLIGTIIFPLVVIGLILYFVLRKKNSKPTS